MSTLDISIIVLTGLVSVAAVATGIFAEWLVWYDRRHVSNS